jgi:hypothetical protein
MAKVGRKPKPALLREMEGNKAHRPIIPDPVLNMKRGKANDLEPPCELEGRRKQIWDNFIRYVPWLTWADTYSALQFVALAEKLETGKKMTAAENIQFRSISNSLGLTPSARADRLAAEGQKPVSKIGSLLGKQEAA